MGRPLNKKYFGNRNIGTGTYEGTSLGNSVNYEDDKIGGGFLASVSNGTVGAIQINNTYKNFPTLDVAAPTIPGGVTATLAVTWEIAAITVGGTNTGYTINQTGAAVTNLNGLYSQTSVDPVLTINTNGSGNVSAINITSRGEFTEIDGTGITTWGIEGAGGSNAQATVTFRVKSISVTEKGSGYIGTPALSWSAVNGGTMPSAQSVTMGTDTGAAGSTTNQENAIVIRANVSDNGNKIGDIIKQVSTHRYKVKTADGIGIVELITGDSTPNVGKAMIIATDSKGSTYWVTKLTSRKAVVYQKSMVGSYDFTDGLSVKWTFGSAVAPTTGEIGVVTIENA
jgi:hypothetical protein